MTTKSFEKILFYKIGAGDNDIIRYSEYRDYAIPAGEGYTSTIKECVKQDRYPITAKPKFLPRKIGKADLQIHAAPSGKNVYVVWLGALPENNTFGGGSSPIKALSFPTFGIGISEIKLYYKKGADVQVCGEKEGWVAPDKGYVAKWASFVFDNTINIPEEVVLSIKAQNDGHDTYIMN